jgi:glycerol-3-phosphate dehydrogenase
MTARAADIVIVGAGIAGLWTFHRLKKRGYDVLLLEKDSIGGDQTIASQGIIHSGLKFAIAGKISTLARSISAMPDIWRTALKGEGEVDLRTAKTAADSQLLMIPGGLMGNLSKIVTKKALGKNVREVAERDWPDRIKSSGFNGSVVFMDELVLDIPSILAALAEPYRNAIRKIPQEYADDPAAFLTQQNITAKKIIFTAAWSNLPIAKQQSHEQGLTSSTARS